MTGSLRLRLAVGSCLAIGLSLLLVWYVLNRTFRDYLIETTLSELTVLSDSLAANVSLATDKVVLDSMPVDPRLNLPAGGRYWQISQDGAPPIRSRSLWDLVLDPTKFKPFWDKRFFEAEGPDGEALLVLASQTKLAGTAGPKNFLICTALAKSEFDDALNAFDQRVQFMLILTALVLGTGAVVQGLVGLRPLDRLRKNVSAIRMGERSNLGDDGPSEVRPLVREINLLLSERSTAVARARARASDLAHGLKTPLTVLSHLAEGLEPNAREIALQQVDLIRQRSDRQLQAARLGVEQMASTRVADIAGKLANVLRPVMDAREIALKFDISDSLLVYADPADLAEALGNILDNAVKWATSEIEISGVNKNGMISITISDDGPGIEDGTQDAILQRGVHLDNSKGGSGLGLAITDDITRAYGGFLALASAPKGGLAVTLNFPSNDQLVKKSTPY